MIEKKNILLVGLFYDRNVNFFNELMKTFNVFIFQEECPNLENVKGLKIVENIIEENKNFDNKYFSLEISKGLLYLNNEVNKILQTNTNELLADDELELFYHRSHHSYFKTKKLDALVLKIKIDMIIMSADYDSTRRSVALRAKALSIPTFSIAHGFFAGLLHAENYKLGKHFMVENASDFANYNSELEVNFVKRFMKYNGTTYKSKLLALGTPQDNSSNNNLTRKDALKILNLDDNKKTITLVGSWEEARSTDVILTMVATIKHYENIFKALSKLYKTSKYQIIVKLHPTFVADNLFSDVSAGIKLAAENYEINLDLIIATNITEVLSATDILIALGNSSVLWENFLGGKPGILFLNKYEQKMLGDSSTIKHNNEIFSSGSIQVVYEYSDLENTINNMLTKDMIKIIQVAVANITVKYNLGSNNPLKVSQRICAWILEYITSKS